MKKKDSIIVSKEEVKQDLKKSEKKDKQRQEVEDATPSWYHYVIILLVFFGGFYLIYQVFEFFDDEPVPTVINSKTYKYPYKVGNVTYNIHFHTPIDELEKLDYPIEIDKLVILNTLNVRFSFLEYNGTDNGKVTQASSKLVSFLNLVFSFKFDSGSDFVKYNQVNCTNSTVLDRIVVFNPYDNRTGIFEGENGCILVSADNITKILPLTDKFIYSLTQ